MKITIKLSGKSAKAMKAICTTRNVDPERFASAIVGCSLIDCIYQGPGEVVECYVDRAASRSFKTSDDWKGARQKDARAKLRLLGSQAKDIRSRKGVKK